MKSLYCAYTPQDPDVYLFLDTETKTRNISPIEKLLTYKMSVLSFYNLETEYEYTKAFWRRGDLCDAINKVSHDYKHVVLFAHNAWFDMKIAGLHTYLPKHGYRLTNIYVAESSRNCFFYFKNGKHTLKIINSYNFLPLPLSAIGEIIGYPKLEVDFDTCTDKELEVYCKRDVEILRKGIVGYRYFLIKMGFEGMRPTLASQAYNAVIGSHKCDRIYYHEKPEIQAFERKAYSGGRTEAFHIGEIPGTVYCYDVNSMYPHIMSEGNLPTKFKGYVDFRLNTRKVKPVSWQTFLAPFEPAERPLFHHRMIDDNMMFLAECDIDTDVPIYPYKSDGKLMFPVGQFTSVLAPTEFYEAYTRNHIRKIHRLCVYSPGNPFRVMIEQLYNARRRFREEGNNLYSIICKLLMNSSYGKLAESVPEEIDKGDCDPSEFGIETLINEKGVQHETCFAGTRILRSREKYPTEKTVYAPAAEVTARARMVLWDLIEFAGKDHVYYCDTDSVFVDRIGHNRLKKIAGDALGQVSLEWRADDVEIRGLKDYTYGEITKIKGVRKDAEISYYENSFTQDQFQGFYGDMRQHMKEGVKITRVVKTLKRKYEKGDVSRDGRVVPFTLSLVI